MRLPRETILLYLDNHRNNKKLHLQLIKLIKKIMKIKDGI
jgi:hypothetical protein